MKANFLWLISLITLSMLLLSACGGQGNSNLTPEQEAVLQRGELVFQANCSACHSTSVDVKIVGPSLAGIASQAGEIISGTDARSYIEQSILEPGAYLSEGYQNLMPDSYSSSLSKDDLEALVDYLMTFE